MVTSSPSPLLLNKLAFVAIVPRSAPDHAISHPVGTGPYRFVSGAPREALEGEAFERYWGPRPAFARFRVVPLPDARSRAHAIVERRADVVSRFPFEFTSWARGRKGMTLASRVGLGVAFLGFSLREGSPYRDRRVREAFALAIDRTRMIDASGARVHGERGAVRPGRRLRVRATLPALGLTTSPARAPSSPRRVTRRAWTPRSSSPTRRPASGHGSARSSGKQESGSASRRSRGTTTTRAGPGRRSTSSDSPTRRGRETPRTSSTPSSTTPSVSSGALNTSGYSSAAFDRLVDEAGRLLDPYERRRLMNEALAILREDLPAIPLVVRSNLYAVSDEITWTARQDRRVRAQDMRLARPTQSRPCRPDTSRPSLPARPPSGPGCA